MGKQLVDRSWAVVLAAGEGTRLRSITRRGDDQVPKQFCSFCDERSLLGATIDRAADLLGRERVVVVVAEEHRRFWEHELRDLPPANVVVQPANRGTAAGILLPLVRVASHDPGATVLVLPSDHYVADEALLRRSLWRALRFCGDGRAVLLGIAPDEADSGYGWIVPGAHAQGDLCAVEAFVEKPDLCTAENLLRRGALWSSFIFAAPLATLFALYQQTLSGLLSSFVSVAQEGAGERDRGFTALYRDLQPRDFSRDVLQQVPRGVLRVLRVPTCGWSDLGTPARLRACLDGFADSSRRPRSPAPRRQPRPRTAALELSERLAHVSA